MYRTFKGQLRILLTQLINLPPVQGEALDALMNDEKCQGNRELDRFSFNNK